MKRAKYKPLLVLLFTFLLGCAFTSVVWVALAASKAEGDIDPIELVPMELDFIPKPEDRFMGLPPAPDCWHLYDNSNHGEWSKCMGVEYQSRKRRGDRMNKGDGEITRVILDLEFFDTVYDLRHTLKTKGGCTDCGDTLGISHCTRDVEKNEAQCRILTVRPKRIDDGPTTVLGHEVEHGVYGRFHK